MVLQLDCKLCSNYIVHLFIIVLPHSVELDVTDAIINQSFNATCLASGYPPPEVYISLNCIDIMLFHDPIRVDNYTMRIVMLLDNFPPSCSTISCYSYPVNCTETINRTVVTPTSPHIQPATPTTSIATGPPTNSVVPTSAHGSSSRVAGTMMIMLLLLVTTILL